jgi:hypothetical protein
LQVRWPQTSRFPRLPLWAVGVVVFWGLLLIVLFLIEQHYRIQAESCPFHWMTGHPCATCGSTRALVALMQGRVLEALRYNPLIAAILMLGGILSLLRLSTGRSLTFQMKPAERWIVGILALLVFTGNWVWVLQVLD